MKRNLRLGVMLGIFVFGSTLFAIAPAVHATWYNSNFQCSLSPGVACGKSWDSALQLDTKVDSTSPSTYMCAGYEITAGTGSGNIYCTVVSGSGTGSTFNNDGTQSVESFYLDCTTTLCGSGHGGVSTTGSFTDSAFINAPPP